MGKYYRDMDTVRENIKITQRKKRPTPISILKKLVDFIEENSTTYEIADEGNGYTAMWRSEEFNNLINRAKEIIIKGDKE